MSKLNSNGGLWSRISSAFERSDIATADAFADGEDAIRTTATRYAPIRDAVERRVNAFLRKDLVSHLEIGPNEQFVLHYIEISAEKDGAEELAHFLREFSPESRVYWVKKLLGPAVGRHVSVEQFLGLDRDFPVEVLAETDPFEEALNQNARPLYRVILHGRWGTGEEGLPPLLKPTRAEEGLPPLLKPPRGEPGFTSALGIERVEGPSLRLSIHDAANSTTDAREIEVDRFPALLGSSAQADVALSGYYVSATHCTLHWDGRQVWLEDHSTNGTWVDGERVQRGARIALANGAALDFGRHAGDGDHERYPSVGVQFTRNPVVAATSGTPVAPSRATPVAPVVSKPARGARPEAPLAVLVIADASGSPRRDVLELPFTIGRGSAQDYVVPDANQGVSREHLVIGEINADGAIALNLAVARNGTSAHGRPLPERFVWRFGEAIALGEKWSGAQAVKISLEKVEPRS